MRQSPEDPKFSIESLESGASSELERFLDAEWARWHADQVYDAAVDWSAIAVALIARDAGGTIIGAAAGRIRAGVGHLSELMTGRERRGQGVGAELVRRFEEHCWDLGCHKLTVHTDTGAPARGFYERRGWREEALFRRDRGGRDFVRLCKFRPGDRSQERGKDDVVSEDTQGDRSQTPAERASS